MSQYSVPWQRTESGGWEGSDFTIEPVGGDWVLRFRGAYLHTGLTDEECKTKADWYRGVGSGT